MDVAGVKTNIKPDWQNQCPRCGMGIHPLEKKGEKVDSGKIPLQPQPCKIQGIAQRVSQGGHWPKESLRPLRQGEQLLAATVVCFRHGAEHQPCSQHLWCLLTLRIPEAALIFSPGHLGNVTDTVCTHQAPPGVCKQLLMILIQFQPSLNVWVVLWRCRLPQ